MRKELNGCNRQLFQLLNHMCRKMSKLKLWCDILSDMISYNGWPDSHQECNTLKLHVRMNTITSAIRGNLYLTHSFMYVAKHIAIMSDIIIEWKYVRTNCRTQLQRDHIISALKTRSASRE